MVKLQLEKCEWIIPVKNEHTVEINSAWLQEVDLISCRFTHTHTHTHTHIHMLSISPVSSPAPTWFLISPSSTRAIDPGCQATPKIPKDRCAQACARIDQHSCKMTHIHRDVQKENGCHGDICRLAAKASLNVYFSRGWQKRTNKVESFEFMFFYWKKKSKDEHVQLGMNINRTQGGQSKQTPVDQSPRLHSSE